MARRLRYSPSGPFTEGSDDGANANVYSVENDAVESAAETPVSVLDWEVPTGAGGTFAIHWSIELNAAIDTGGEAQVIGLVALEANAVEVAQGYAMTGGLESEVPWFAVAGNVVRELAAGETVEMFITGLTEGGIQCRRRRFVIYPVTVLT